MGGFLGVAVYILFLFPRYVKKVDASEDGTVPPEDRLPMSMIGGPMVVVGFLCKNTITSFSSFLEERLTCITSGYV